MLEFCRLYNEATAARRGLVVPTLITVFDDRSFTVETRQPTAASLLKRAAGLDRAAAHPNGTPVGSITRAQLREIAALKLPDMNAVDLAGAERMIAGTARSMGIAVRD
jgi:large subunit ribosomal protein L11